MPSTDARWSIGAILVVCGILSAQIAGVNNRLDRIESDVRGLDARLRTVEVTFAKIEQRLETLERVILPAADPAE